MRRKRVALVFESAGRWWWVDADATRRCGSDRSRRVVISEAESLGYEIETDETIAESLAASNT